MRIGKHTSLKKDLRLLVRKIEKQSFVDKIILGNAVGCNHKQGTKIRYVANTRDGVQLKGYGCGGIIDIFVKTKRPDDVVNYLGHSK